MKYVAGGQGKCFQFLKASKSGKQNVWLQKFLERFLSKLFYIENLKTKLLILKI